MSLTQLIARRNIRTVAGAAGLALVMAAPTATAAAATVPTLKLTKNTATNPLNCTVDHAVSRPFSTWNDHADYALAPGGDFETAGRGWTLSRGAAVVAGNQPFAIGTTGGASLRLPAHASAVSTPMCIDSRFPHFRLVARNTGKLKSELKAEVLFLNPKGSIKAIASGTVQAPSAAWSPSDSLMIGVTFNTAVAAGAAPVSFRFTSGGSADWQIDDLYVDPRMR